MGLAHILATLGALAPPPGDARAEVEAWSQRFDRREEATAEDELERLTRSLADLRGYALLSPRHTELAGRALLDLCSVGLAATDGADDGRRGEGWRLRDLAAAELAALPESVVAWAAREVLVAGADNPTGRRRAAAQLLQERPEPLVTHALTVAVRDEDLVVARAAAEALVGRMDAVAHALFARLLQDEATPADLELAASAEAHFRRVRLASGDPVGERLERLVGAGIADASWRVAARAVAVSRALPDERAVEQLIGALAEWETRRALDTHARRIEGDVVRALEERSGLRLGAHPDRWRVWWDARRAGDDRPRPVAEPAEAATVGFFGLRAESEHLVFVLDRSGSMSLDLPGAKSERISRYEASIEEMARALETIGSAARFDLVLFHDGVEAWRPRPQPARSTAVSDARAWALRRVPSGGTQLRHGIERAFELEPDGSVDLERLETDTIVVLCDGATDEGAQWVVPFLRRVNSKARVVIHGVQIGDEGDGALEALARETGGDFVRITAGSLR